MGGKVYLYYTILLSIVGVAGKDAPAPRVLEFNEG